MSYVLQQQGEASEDGEYGLSHHATAVMTGTPLDCQEDGFVMKPQRMKSSV